jgi:hypothetical protein
MFGGYRKDHFLYICTPKNGSTTFSALLSNNGWQYVDLLDNDLDYEQFNIWGHITNPDHRHTKGLAEYLRLNPDIDITNDNVAKMLVTGIFDGHAASLSMLLGPLFFLPTIQWIPLDIKVTNYFSDPPVIVTGNDITNDFFIENGINIRVSANDVKNQVTEESQTLRDKIVELKNKFNPTTDPEKYNGTWLGSYYRYDNLLYAEVTEKYYKRYTKKTRTWLN